MLKVMTAAVLIGAALLQGCAVQRPLSAPTAIENEVYLDTSWRRGVDGRAGEASERFNLVAQDEKLYFVTEHGSVYGLQQETGRRVDYIQTDFEPSAGVTVKDGMAYFGTYDAQLVAVSLEQKSVLWEKTLTSEILAEPAVANGRIAVQTGGGWLSVIDAQSANTLWRDKEDLPALTVRGTSAPVIVGNTLIAGFANGTVNAYNLVDGTKLWSFEVGKAEGRYEIERLTDVNGRLVVRDGMVYAVAYNGTLSAINLTTGRPVWQRNIPSGVGVALENDVLIAVEQDSTVHALNAKNGEVIWQNEELVGRELISPTYFRDYVAVVDRSGYVHLLDRDNGKVKAWFLADTVAPVGSRMVSNGQQLFILTPDSKITALSY